MITSLREGEDAEWLRMRRALWPDCSEAMHQVEIAERRANGSAVFVYRRESGSLGAFIEVSVRNRVDGSLSPRVAYVEGWFVDEDLRHRGIGRELIGQAEAWAKANGLTELASDAELENAESIAAHHALGFQETFRLVHFIRPIT